MGPSVGEPGEVRRERPHFAMIPKPLLFSKVSALAIRLYATLDDYTGEHRYAWPSISRLSDDLGCSHDSVQRATAELEKAGYLRVERRKAEKKVNRYTLLLRPRAVDISTRSSASTRQNDPSPTRTSASRTIRSELNPNGAASPEVDTRLPPAVVEQGLANVSELRAKVRGAERQEA